MTPDSMPEKDYFTMLINDTIAAWEGARDITGSQFQGNALWKWGNTIGKQDW